MLGSPYSVRFPPIRPREARDLKREANAPTGWYASTGLDDGRLLRVAARGSDGELLAGLCGWTWGGCGYVEFLWVRADQRGSGLGTRVLVAAEEEVRRRGCEQVALSTHSFQAPRFYARRGYVECGRTPAYPRGHDQIHLVKRLD
jgi:GNAT superfamily N-acetyltransferase